MRRLSDIIGLRQEKDRNPAIPQNMVVFAVGDIRGQINSLVQAHQKILHLEDNTPEPIKKYVVYMGDYADYGPFGADVIDLLLSAPLIHFKPIYLLGNQDLFFLKFLRGGREILRGDPKLIRWLVELGGMATLKSYGVTTNSFVNAKTMIDMRQDLLRKIPSDHIGFYQNLVPYWSIGDFFFSHTGSKNQKALHETTNNDLLNFTPYVSIESELQDKIIIHSNSFGKAEQVQQRHVSLAENTQMAQSIKTLMISRDNLAWIEI